jgi:hypothetical protein
LRCNHNHNINNKRHNQTDYPLTKQKKTMLPKCLRTNPHLY